MTPAGVAPFQPCEYLFGTMKTRLARLPDIVDTKTTSIHGKRVAIENILRSTSKSVIKGCLRAAEHFREAWLVRAQSASSGGSPLSLEVVEELVRKSRAESNIQRPSQRRDVGTYQSELDILTAMLNEHKGILKVRFKPE